MERQVHEASVIQAAQLLGVSASTVRRWLGSGKLDGRRVAEGRGTSWRVRLPPELPAGRVRGCGLEFDEERRAAYFNGTDLRCTPIELAILQAMAALPGQALPHAFINQRVWSYPNLPDGTLLKGHISAIRRKLREAGGDDAMLRTVPKVGYALAAGSGG